MKNRKKPSKEFLIAIAVIVSILVVISIGLITVYWKAMKTETTLTGTTSYGYDCTAEIQNVLDSYQQWEQLPQVISEGMCIDNVISINFEGAPSPELLQRILKQLEQTKLKATFFIPGNNMNSSDAAAILQAGHDVQNYTLTAPHHLEELSAEMIATEICRAQAICTHYLGYAPTMLKCNATVLNDDILAMAGAAGMTEVLHSTRYVNVSSFADDREAEAYVKKLPYGAIINIKLDDYLDAVEYTPKVPPATPAKDKQPSVAPVPAVTVPQPDKTVMDVIQWLTQAISEANLKTVPVKEITQYSIGDAKQMSEEMAHPETVTDEEIPSFARTTDREVAFVFHNLGNAAVTQAALDQLQAMGIKASFLVTGMEASNHPDVIQKIAESGCELINGGFSGKYMGEATYEEVFADMYTGKVLLEKNYKLADYYIPRGMADTQAIRQAASALDLELIGYNLSPLKAAYLEEALTPEEIVDKAFDASKEVLCRGDILMFDLGFVQNGEQLSEILKLIYEQKVLPACIDEDLLEIVTVTELLDHTWNHPASTPETTDQVHPLETPVTSSDPLDLSRYIGIGDRNASTSGFSYHEQVTLRNSMLDIEEGRNTMFLTFDDWGTERSITRILDVLDKHDVKATFFVTTQYIRGSAENLLRAIAEDGHEIASHSDKHTSIKISTQEQSEALAEDLVTSYQTLERIVGDTGALTTYFRPPRLEISRLGFSTVFGTGYSHIISADVSTGDYEASNAEELVESMKNGVFRRDGFSFNPRSGSIIILHLFEDAPYTSEALDQYLTWQESLPTGDPQKYEFGLFSHWLSSE